MQSSFPPFWPSFPNSRAVGSSNIGGSLPTWCRWLAMSCKADRDMMVDWAPVSNIAIIGTPSILSSTSSNEPTAPAHEQSAFTTLFELLLTSRSDFSRSSFFAANSCSSCSSERSLGSATDDTLLVVEVRDCPGASARFGQALRR